MILRTTPNKPVLSKTSNTASVQTKAHYATSTVIAALVMLFSMTMPELALAGTPWDNFATNLLAFFTGGFARTIAIIAVIGLGIASLAGRISWDIAIKVSLGIILIFGAATIVDLFAGWQA